MAISLVSYLDRSHSTDQSTESFRWLDFQKVFVEYAKNIKGKIHLNSTITNIGMNEV